MLVAAANIVANATMKLMASDQAQPQLRDQRRDGSVVWDGITFYRCFRDTGVWRLAGFCLLASSNLGRNQTTLPI